MARSTWGFWYSKKHEDWMTHIGDICNRFILDGSTEYTRYTACTENLFDTEPYPGALDHFPDYVFLGEGDPDTIVVVVRPLDDFYEEDELGEELERGYPPPETFRLPVVDRAKESALVLEFSLACPPQKQIFDLEEMYRLSDELESIQECERIYAL